MRERRLKLLKITPSTLIDLLKRGGDIRVIANFLPADAESIAVSHERNRWHYDIDYDVIVVLVHSSEFPVVHEGYEIPEIEKPVYTRFCGKCQQSYCSTCFPKTRGSEPPF